MFFIRNRRYSLIFLSGFTRGEYHIVIVDFIVALRRTKGRRRRTLRSPSPPSSGLHLLTPGKSAAAGKCLLPRAYRDIGSLFPVQTVHPHFDVSFGCFVFGLRSLAFQKITVGLCRSFFIGGGWTVYACGYVALCYGYLLGLPLTAPFFPISYRASPFHQ